MNIYSGYSFINEITVEKERTTFSLVCLKDHSHATSIWVCPTHSSVIFSDPTISDPYNSFSR